LNGEDFDRGAFDLEGKGFTAYSMSAGIFDRGGQKWGHLTGGIDWRAV